MVAKSKQHVQMKNAVAISSTNIIGKALFTESELFLAIKRISISELFHRMIIMTAAPKIYGSNEISMVSDDFCFEIWIFLLSYQLQYFQHSRKRYKMIQIDRIYISDACCTAGRTIRL